MSIFAVRIELVKLDSEDDNALEGEGTVIERNGYHFGDNENASSLEEASDVFSELSHKLDIRT